MMPPPIRQLLRQTIHVAPLIDETSSGDGVFGAPVAAAARVEPRRVVTGTSATGEEDVSDWRVFTEAAVGVRDMVWLPGTDPADRSVGRRPKVSQAQTDVDGSISHWEVLL